MTLVAEEIYVEGNRLEDQLERQIAKGFMMFSGLGMTERVVKNSNGTVKSYDLVFAPVGEGATAHLVPMSGMFSARYIAATKSEDGAILRIRRDPTPTWRGSFRMSIGKSRTTYWKWLSLYSARLGRSPDDPGPLADRQAAARTETAASPKRSPTQ